MRMLRSLLITSLVVVVSNAQENSHRSVLPEGEGNEFEPLHISEPDARETEMVKTRDERSRAALHAVEKGNDLWRSGEIEKSAISYQQAINLNPSLYSAQYNLGLTLLHTKQYRQAARAFNAAVRLRPESISAWQSLGFAHHYGKDYEKAVEAFRQAQQLAPQEAVTNNNLGFAHLYASQFRHAINSFKHALRIDPRFTAAISGLCSATALGETPVKAFDACLNAANTNAHSAVPHYFLGLAYLDRGEPDKGLTTLKKAARIEPRTARIYVGLGFAFLQLRNFDEALKYFEHARKLNGDVNHHALLGLGVTYVQLKDYKNAEKALREAVSADPDNPTARFNLAMVCLARRNRDCALSQYNRLKMMDHSAANTLFTTIFGDRIVDASKYKKP